MRSKEFCKPHIPSFPRFPESWLGVNNCRFGGGSAVGTQSIARHCQVIPSLCRPMSPTHCQQILSQCQPTNESTSANAQPSVSQCQPLADPRRFPRTLIHINAHQSACAERSWQGRSSIRSISLQSQLPLYVRQVRIDMPAHIAYCSPSSISTTSPHITAHHCTSLHQHHARVQHSVVSTIPAPYQHHTNTTVTH